MWLWLVCAVSRVLLCCLLKVCSSRPYISIHLTEVCAWHEGPVPSFRMQMCSFPSNSCSEKMHILIELSWNLSKNPSTKYARTYFWAFRSIVLCVFLYINIILCRGGFFLNNLLVLTIYFVTFSRFFYILDYVICK